MTNEDAVKSINALIDLLKVVDAQPHIKEEDKFKPSTYEALKMAIKALEAQPQDAVSRKAVLNIFNEWFATCNIADKRESPKAKINALPPIIPQRKMGKWIAYNWKDGDICRWGIKCSECHTEYKHGGEMWHNPKFCPDCGIEMEDVKNG